MNMVTAEGRLVRASNDENEDLFWGLRGGGGNFGVVTSIDYLLHPVGTEIIGGIVAWPLSEAPGVFELLQKLRRKRPARAYSWYDNAQSAQSYRGFQKKFMGS